MHTVLRCTVALLVLLPCAAAPPDVRKIWDRGEHNAFTSLIRWRGAFYCALREASSHVGGSDGKIRVIRSSRGDDWHSVALLTEDTIDLRDPKLSVTPDGRLMVLMGGSRYDGRTLLGQRGRVGFLSDPSGSFSPLQKLVIDPEVATTADWVWRVTWLGDTGYGTLYQRDDDAHRTLRIMRTTDGVHYTHHHTFDFASEPGEATIRFNPDGRMVLVIRDESDARIGHIGVAAAPFTDWAFQTIAYKLGGPDLVRLPSGAWILGTRHHRDDGRRTVLGPVQLDGGFAPSITLPSGGDTSYPGFVIHDGILWVSYYASHEEKTSVYLAQIPLSELP